MSAIVAVLSVTVYSIHWFETLNDAGVLFVFGG